MSYFDDQKNVEEYIKMADGFDGRELIEILKQHLAVRKTVLELGMGPGKDLEILSVYYTVTGSDYSQVFIDRYQKLNPNADLMRLDAITLETDRTFDCIYSNKVLHHLSESELTESFQCQKKLLNPGGILFHSFWHGDKTEFMQGMRFVYYTKKTLLDRIDPDYNIIACEQYAEFEDDDSFFIILQPNDIT